MILNIDLWDSISILHVFIFAVQVLQYIKDMSLQKNIVCLHHLLVGFFSPVSFSTIIYPFAILFLPLLVANSICSNMHKFSPITLITVPVIKLHCLL